jgi:hypothetical protein
LQNHSPKEQGAGNAGCALHPRSRVQNVRRDAHDHTGTDGAIRKVKILLAKPEPSHVAQSKLARAAFDAMIFLGRLSPTDRSVSLNCSVQIIHFFDRTAVRRTLRLAMVRTGSMNTKQHVSIGLGGFFLAAATVLPANAETLKDKLSGTWTLVLSDNVNPDGSRVHLYGPDPQGMLTFDATGHYALQIMSKDRPKFAANDKSKGTPEEYRASVVGTQCHFGTYKVDEQNNAITIHVEHATYTNWEGSDLTWPVVMQGDEVKFTVPHPTIGGPGVHGEIAYKRTH